MPVWLCPNPKCKNDQELHAGQRCPLCGKDAEEFKFGEVGGLLKEKYNSKKLIERNNRNKRMSDRIKYCPTCGSTNIFWASGFPQLWSLWECKECGYRGPLVLEDGKLGAKLRKEWKKKPQESNTSNH
jgi:DNA-directed RNA polymerase subunit M